MEKENIEVMEALIQERESDGLKKKKRKGNKAKKFILD